MSPALSTLGTSGTLLAPTSHRELPFQRPEVPQRWVASLQLGLHVSTGVWRADTPTPALSGEVGRLEGPQSESVALAGI